MGLFQTMSGYFKQFTGEVVGSQSLHDEGKRETVEAAAAPSAQPESDAAGQFRRTRAGADNDGLASASPRVISESDDATAGKRAPGEAPAGPDWSVGFDDRAPRADQSSGRSESTTEDRHGSRP